MPESKQMYANVIVPLALQGTFTYSVPQAMQSSLRTGCRVLVQFGRKKTYTAIVVALHFTKPEGYDVKEILAMLDDKPIIRHPQLDLWQWIADYYLCTIGEVYKAAVPSGLKVESETFISINPEYEETEDDRLNDRERVIMDFAAQRGRVQLDEISRSTGFKNVVSIVSRMLEREAIHIAARAVSYTHLTLLRRQRNGREQSADLQHQQRRTVFGYGHYLGARQRRRHLYHQVEGFVYQERTYARHEGERLGRRSE